MAGSVTVYAYGNSDALHGTFNAIAMIMGANDFADMVKVCLIIGFLSVAIVAMLPRSIDKSWNWFMSVAVLNSLLLVPTTDVVIVDKLNIKPTVAVGNVPWTLGVVGMVKSSIGATLTDLFDTAFQSIPASGQALPSELGYLRTGVLFGNRMIKGAREATVIPSDGNADLLNYMRSCIFPDAENLGNAVQSSTDLFALVSTPNPALIVAVHDSTGQLDTMSCQDAWPLVSNGLMRTGGWADEAIRSLATKSFPDRAVSDAITSTESALLTAWSTKTALMPAATTAKEVMVQNIMINAAADAAALQSASVNDPALLTLAAARSQAVAQMNAGFLTQSRIAEEALPLIRNVVEAILYAVFPVICLLAFVLEGQALRTALKSYLLVLVWVELWPAMFAIVNFLQTNASAINLHAAGASSSGLSLATAAAVYGTSVSDLSVASWMVTFVPVIAAALLFGTHQIASSIGSAKAGASESASAAGAAVSGNTNLGNMTMGQQNVAQYSNDPFVATRAGLGGSRSTSMLSGQAVDTYAVSSGPVDLGMTAQLGSQLSQRSVDALDVSHKESTAFAKSIDAGWGELVALSKDGGRSVDRSTQDAVGRVASEAEARSDAETHSNRILDQLGISRDSEVAKSLKAELSARAGIGVEGKTPTLGGLIPASANAYANLEGALAASGMSKDSETITKQVNQAAEDVKARQAMRKQEVMGSYQHSSGYKTAQSQSTTATSKIDSSLREGAQHREASEMSMAQARRDEVAAAKISAFAKTGSARYANELYDFMRARGQDPNKGVARTREQVELLNEFIQSGELTGPGGEWVSAHFNGPNNVQSLTNFNRGNLADSYAGGSATVPGRADVLEAHRRDESSVQGAQKRSGVSPTAVPGGRDIQLGVETETGRMISNMQRGEANWGTAEAKVTAARQTVSRGHAPLGLSGSGNFITGQGNSAYAEILGKNALDPKTLPISPRIPGALPEGGSSDGKDKP